MARADDSVTTVVAARAVADGDADVGTITSGVGAHVAADSATISTEHFLVGSRSNSHMSNNNTTSSNTKRHA